MFLIYVSIKTYCVASLIHISNQKTAKIFNYFAYINYFCSIYLE